MCGIAGIVGKGAGKEIPAGLLAHRGPDSTACWSAEDVHLRHWRLRVLDLSPAADQPMRCGNAVIAYNGEVYNWRELREELGEVLTPSSGHPTPPGGKGPGVFRDAESLSEVIEERRSASREPAAIGPSARHARATWEWRTNSDTEVILRAYERWGSHCVEHLRGMYAFALWDEGSRRLTLARDPFGVKPLYYSEGPEGVTFASELPALLALLDRRPEPDRRALWDFFTFGFVPAPATAFEGVVALSPGEVAEFDAEGRRCGGFVGPLPWMARGSLHRGEGTGLREALVSSVREQFAADVPVGVFLSGGVDSNVIVAAAREAGIEKIHTFTVDFRGSLEGDSHDETAEARASARFFGTEHTEVPVRLGSAEELLADLDRFGEPFANPTVYLTRLLSRETRRHVTVALSGAGGDELFGGYPRYAALSRLRALRGAPGRALALAGRAASSILKKRTPRSVRRAAWLSGQRGAPPDRAYLGWTYYLNEREKTHLLPGLAAAGADSLRILEGPFRRGATLGHSFLSGPASDLSLFLPDNVLAYTDVGSMAESLEVRVPFLDPDVAYLALRSLQREDLGIRRPKRLLRRLFRDALPPHVLRGKKRGFNPPLARWIRVTLDPLFDSEETAGFRKAFVDAAELNRMRAAHRSGVEDYSQELLAVLSAARWWKKSEE
jgi:asparagine synthase (glutamine-hydrolysing)